MNLERRYRSMTIQVDYEYVNTHPIEFIESIRGTKLNWLQKIYLRKMFNLNKEEKLHERENNIN
jgi:hypothetical protein